MLGETQGKWLWIWAGRYRNPQFPIHAGKQTCFDSSLCEKVKPRQIWETVEEGETMEVEQREENIMWMLQKTLLHFESQHRENPPCGSSHNNKVPVDTDE